jgi:hypothetical protein
MYKENEVMEELDKFFEDDEKSKKKYKMLLKFSVDSSYKGKVFLVPPAEKKKIKKKIIRVHKKGKDNDNIF